MSEIKTLTVNGHSYTVADPDAAHIDDTAVGEKAWSSRRIREAVDEADSSAAIVCKAAGSAITVNDASARGLRGLTLYGKTTQSATPTPDAPVPLESIGAGGNIGVEVLGKNLLPYPYGDGTSKTTNGITYTVNADGSVTANGTATATAYFELRYSYNPFNLKGGERYILSGCPKGGSADTYTLRVQDNSYTQNVVDEGGSAREFTANYEKYYAFITIKAGVTANNLTFYPLLRLAAVNDDAFQLYNKQTLTVTTLNGLPGIPVSSGSNYTDEIDFARGVHVQRVKSISLSGADSEAWSEQATTTGLHRYNLRINDIKPGRGMALCSALPMTNEVDFSNVAEVSFDTHAQGNWLNCWTNFETLDAWKAYLASTPMTVVYVLKEPIETPLTAEELAAFAALRSNKPNTTVLNDAGAEMAVQYIADTKLYIDSKLAAISAAMLNN